MNDVTCDIALSNSDKFLFLFFRLPNQNIRSRGKKHKIERNSSLHLTLDWYLRDIYFFCIVENFITLLILCVFCNIFFQHETLLFTGWFPFSIYFTCVFLPLRYFFILSLSRWKIFTYFLYLKTFSSLFLINCFIRALLRVWVFPSSFLWLYILLYFG